MTGKIILDIRHSDDYTDFLFMTAALTNKRVVPMLDPSREDIRRQGDNHTLVLRCVNVKREPGPKDRMVSADLVARTIRVLSKSYLLPDGEIDFSKAEAVRGGIENAINLFLLEPKNVREVYRHHFPMLWLKREQIYAQPQFFFAFCGRYSSLSVCGGMVPLGAVLKAIDENPEAFSIPLQGGCNCSTPSILLDYEKFYDSCTSYSWRLHTWCPVCHARREFQVDTFKQLKACNMSIDRILKQYDRGQGISNLSLFDVIDTV